MAGSGGGGNGLALSMDNNTGIEPYIMFSHFLVSYSYGTGTIRVLAC